MIIEKNRVNQDIVIGDAELRLLLKALLVQQFHDESRDLRVSLIVHKIDDMACYMPSEEDIDSWNLNHISAIHVYNQYNIDDKQIHLMEFTRNRKRDGLVDCSQWNLEYVNPVKDMPFDIQIYVSNALSRAELIANTKYVEEIPPTAKICLGFKLLNHRYYLMTYMPELPEATPEGVTMPNITGPVYFVKLKSTVKRAIKNGQKIESMYDTNIPDIIPSAYAAFGNVKHINDDSVHYVGITTKDGLEKSIGIDYTDIDDMWKQIDKLKVLPIINIAGKPITMDSIKDSQSLMGLVMIENLNNPDFHKTEPIEDDSSEYTLPAAVGTTLPK